MKNLNRLLSGVTALLAFAAVARGQSLSDLQSAQLFATTNDFQRGVNLQSPRGVPLSGTVGTPTGSDGRISLGQPTATPGQFQGIVSYGAVTVAATPAALGAGSFAANADAIDFPRSKDGATVRLILRAQVGAAWTASEASLLFGGIIAPPDTDINGTALLGAALTNYWAPEPFTTNAHAGAAYYYSPHARQVFAIQAGDVRVVWRRAAALAGQPVDFVGNENVKYALLDGQYYELQPTAQVVAEGAVKLTRKMYWTEGVFAATGKKVTVPTETVKDIKFGYNTVFPQYVPTNEVFAASGSSSPFGAGTGPVDTRTVRSEFGFISADNKEGRIFVELLGNTVAGSARQHLGYEIVDVAREALPEDVTVELGERLTAFPNNSPSDAGLRPSAFLNATGVKYAYEHFPGTGGAITGDAPREYFATRFTPELNSSQLLWLEQGAGGVFWPTRLVRYQQVWPADAAKYSHYIRPLVATATEAAQTAVQLSAENAPVVESEDTTDQTRSILQPDSKFYTFLDTGVPALRTLLRFNAGGKIRFERVFSWLDANLRTTNFAGSVVTELSAWNPTNSTLNFGGAGQIPRVVNQNVWVGQRLTAPAGESNSVSGISYPGLGAASTGFNYLAGHIRQTEGTGYSVTAYRDPFAVGFDEASTSSIIPVNARNNDARLEVWWFRPNAVNTAVGFKNVFWPSAIGRYTVAWPTNFPHSREIILASNSGSGGLGSVEAKGGLYFQNDPAQPGYNPNEEHALLQDGQAWALRDDLNITSGTNYSSHPYVLLEYTAADGRPSMTAFQVLREKNNVKFDYSIAAGTILQAPMPLPLLDKPLGTREIGEPARSLNIEVRERNVGSATVAEAGGFSRVTLALSERHFFQPYESLALQNVPATGPVTSRWFYSTNNNPVNNELAGVVTTLQPLPLGIWTASAQPADTTKYRFKVASLNGLQPGSPVVVGRAALQTNWVASIADTNIVAGQAFVEIQFTGAAPLAAQTDSVLAVPNSGLLATAFNGWRLAYEPVPESISDPVIRDRFAGFTFQDRKGDTWIYRGPHQVGGSGKMVMQFYYKSLPGFYYPSLASDAQPRPGTLTPYLRPLNPDGSYAGDPVLGDADADNAGDGNPLGIVYRAVWPESTPVLMMAETLATPKRGLPAMRGQTSLQVLYQQPQFAGGLSARAAVLHDPTRQKQFLLGPVDGSAILGKIPDSVRASVYRGKTYFPNLPPHLVDRFYFDPTRGANGGLVFAGEFKQEIVGDSFFLLNVLGPQDAAVLRALCLADDPNKALWDAVINSGLQTTMEQFVEDAGKPGTFVPGPTEAVGPSDLAEVKDQDVAVDSYALTAAGPGTGYVSLIAANGTAFTQTGDPVSVLIVKVTDALYRGELKIVKPSNPLSEMLTLQQVVDLAGKVDDYEFEWLITAPVNGAPPPVYQNTRRLLMGNGTWGHLRFPLATDQPATVHHSDAARVVSEVTTTVAPVSQIPFATVAESDGDLSFVLQPGQVHPLAVGNQVVVRNGAGAETFGTVKTVAATTHLGQPATNLVVGIDAGQAAPASASVIQLYERATAGQPTSVAFREFTVSESALYSQFYLSLDLAAALSAKVYLDGQLVAVAGLGDGDTATVTAPGGFSPLSRVYRLGPDLFGGGKRSGGNATHALAVEFFSTAVPGTQLAFNARLEAYESADQTALPGSPWLAVDSARFLDKVRAVLGGSADVRSLTDNYLVARYRATNETHASFARGWSQWTEPQLAEGWIKRVLAGINPFNQRVTDLFNNQVNTDASIITQAGKRWEGDVALNLENINNAGLIEIYETVLRRGKMLSLEAGINYGPANDALLLAAGYLNDLYMMLGNEAYADASNPTIGIGTKDRNYGDIATALFAFKGQMATLLEEELALLRGRDDFIQPGVEAQPVYNRMFWNYTRGIDAGEVIYALNYNIQPNGGTNASIGAADAAHMFPQGHGDGYGHYLTTVKNYYSLLLNPSFDWVPKSEAVTVLGRAVQVNYQNERKFAAAAAAVARTGSQVLDLTWRRDYIPGDDIGWESLSQSRTNTSRTVPTARNWGVDHWASRTAQGAYLNWAMGNAILPAVDPDPSHEGIQKVDRTTVPELAELPASAEQVQLSLDNAEGHFTPLGLPGSSLAFDINPNQITGVNPKPHFEQIFERAKGALNNAITAFDDAKDITRLMRSDTDSLTDFQAGVAKQELAYTHALIELYGTPYSDDVGPGKTWRQGYAGPDLIHYSYVDLPELAIPAPWDYAAANAENTEFRIDVQDFPPDWLTNLGLTDLNVVPSSAEGYTAGTHYVSFNLGAHGFGGKPASWTGSRAMPGRIQQAISKVIMAHARLRQAAADQVGGKEDLDRAIALFRAHLNTYDRVRKLQNDLLIAEQTLEAASAAQDVFDEVMDALGDDAKDIAEALGKAYPKVFIAGVAAGTDAPGRAADGGGNLGAKGVEITAEGVQLTTKIVVKALELSTSAAQRWTEFNKIAPLERDDEVRSIVAELGAQLGELQDGLAGINARLRERDDALTDYRALVAKGERIQEERLVFRQRAAAITQGYRTRDAAFRIFRNEKLERYKSLFDLSARYTFMAANAYDYETGLLNTTKGKQFISRIVNSRALGVVKSGEPQYAGSNTGDPGLSSVLAEMKADWDVLKGRLGFNNPTAYGTTVSLRMENHRIVNGSEGDTTWKDVLNQARRSNLLEDEDVRRHCMQIAPANSLTVPGLVIEFSTTIADGRNFFGRELAGGDHYFDPSYFATKVFSVGVAFEGYKGMDNPAANSGTVNSSGGTSPSDPTTSFLDPQALAATPGIYLIPVGVDSMRSPPLGDSSAVRSWAVNDVTIPLPFNIGASDFSTKLLYQSNDSLTEPLFNLRKHPAFRPVSTTAAFTSSIYGGGGALQQSQFTNTRLVGRSVWNSKWKLVIPGHKLLSDPNDGLDRFINTVKDVKLHYVTYSYAGN